MSYQAYQPHASHSQALRPVNYQQNTAYEPVQGYDAPSPVDHPSNPFASHRNQSPDSMNGHYYGAGTGGHHAGDTGYRAYGDEIPLRENLSSTRLDSPLGNEDSKKQPLVDESAVTDEEIAREQRRARRRWLRAEDNIFSIGTDRIAWVVYTFTLIQITVFIVELVKMAVLTGSPIETKPTFNIMIGPSPYVTINMGARFLPCMKDESAAGADQQLKWPCPNSTSLSATDPSNQCTIAELCGNGAAPDQFPVNQWWRFITPIFLHAGIIHIGFNMLLQMTMGREMERLIGSIRFFILYMASGIFGFILGGNFAAKGLNSTGASGALFGIVGITLLDLLYTWRSRKNPVRELIFIMLDIVISLVLGLLPGLDNFSHIGGLLMGLVLGVCILRSPEGLRRRTMPTFDPSTIQTEEVNGKRRVRAQPVNYSEFTKGPSGFFRGRNKYWWAFWLVRAGSLVAVLVVFIVLINNFYVNENTCTWCRYLSCLPITTNGVNWCDIGASFTSNSSSPSSSSVIPRGLLEANLLGYH